MRLLLDTHCWLWWFQEPARLNAQARAAIEDATNDAYLSAASGWEIAIKHALGKLRLPMPPAEYVPRRLADQGMTALPVGLAHALRVAELPPIHADPFDRLLVAQAQLERLILVTADAAIPDYDVEILWAGEGERRVGS